MKRLGTVFPLPLDGMLVHRRSFPRNLLGFPQKFAGTHLYSWVERGAVRVKCPAQEHNTVSPARARTRTVRSGDERTNHQATAPPLDDSPKNTERIRSGNEKVSCTNSTSLQVYINVLKLVKLKVLLPVMRSAKYTLKDFLKAICVLCTKLSHKLNLKKRSV